MFLSEKRIQTFQSVTHIRNRPYNNKGVIITITVKKILIKCKCLEVLVAL